MNTSLHCPPNSSKYELEDNVKNTQQRQHNNEVPNKQKDTIKGITIADGHTGAKTLAATTAAELAATTAIKSSQRGKN